MENCLFCRLVAGELPCYKVYEDDKVMAFLDIQPCSWGHTVVIPKKHFERWQDVDTDIAASVAVALQKVAKIISKKLQPRAFNICLNDGKGAGQAIPHVHWHIIPRYAGDGGRSCHAIVKAEPLQDLEATAKILNDQEDKNKSATV